MDVIVCDMNVVVKTVQFFVGSFIENMMDTNAMSTSKSYKVSHLLYNIDCNIHKLNYTIHS